MGKRHEQQFRAMYPSAIVMHENGRYVARYSVVVDGLVVAQHYTREKAFRQALTHIQSGIFQLEAL